MNLVKWAGEVRSLRGVSLILIEFSPSFVKGKQKKVLRDCVNFYISFSLSTKVEQFGAFEKMVTREMSVYGS